MRLCHELFYVRETCSSTCIHFTRVVQVGGQQLFFWVGGQKSRKFESSNLWTDVCKDTPFDSTKLTCLCYKSLAHNYSKKNLVTTIKFLTVLAKRSTLRILIFFQRITHSLQFHKIPRKVEHYELTHSDILIELLSTCNFILITEPTLTTNKIKYKIKEGLKKKL